MSDVAQAARDYGARNFHIIKLKAREKQPLGHWKNKSCEVWEFEKNPELNIAVALGKPSNGLVDFDLDWPQAARVADLLLVGLTTFGRASSPRAHRLARCTDLVDKNTRLLFALPASMQGDPRLPKEHTLCILELRANGHYTMFPPSVHPSGEVIEWGPKTLDSLRDQTWGKLALRAGLVAFTGTMVRFFPPVGVRDQFMMALTGTLARAADVNGLDADMVQQIVQHVGNCAGDPGQGGEWRVQPARAEGRVKDGEPTTGLPTLCEVAGLNKDCERLFRMWLGLVENDKRLTVRSSDHKRQMGPVLDQAETVLQKDHFQVGPRLVSPLRYEANSPEEVAHTADPEHAPKPAVRRQAGALVLQPVSPLRLNETFNERVNWQLETWSEKTGMKVKPISCPQWVAPQYMARIGEWRLPVMRGIIEAPTVRQDGSLLDRPGYDPATGLWLDTGGLEFDPVPDSPTREQGQTALAVFKDAINQFPFVPDREGAEFEAPSASRSVALSAILTGLIRRTIRTAPMHGFTAPTMATGKTLLANCAGIVAVGRAPTAMSQGHDETEDEKRLLGVLLRNDPVLLIDNIKRPVEGDAICIILSEATWQSRLLGENQQMHVPTNVLVLATGNNLTCRGDMETRAIMCSLDARVERPEERRFEGDLREWFIASRPKLVSAGLTALRSFAAAGYPQSDALAPFARFEDWDRRVRHALVWLGEPDPLATRKLVAGRDEVRIELGEIIGALKRSPLGDQGAFLAKDVLTFAATDDDLRLALEAVSHGPLNPKSVSRYLGSISGRVINGLCVRRSDLPNRVGAYTFRVLKV